MPYKNKYICTINLFAVTIHNMNQYKKDLLNALKTLKTDYNAVSTKAEFESEGANFNEALYLKELSNEAGLDFALKIGGCGAIRDIRDAKKLNANTIVAPMIESPYALEKFILSVKNVFSDKEMINKKFLINIETKQGIDCLDEILNCKYSREISGIVVGRTDLAASLGLKKDEVNSEKIFNIVNLTAKKALEYNKELIIGGCVTKTSIPFFKDLPKNSLTRFETRKIILDSKILENNIAIDAVLKAIDFELLWLKYINNLPDTSKNEDNTRLKTLAKRLEQ